MKTRETYPLGGVKSLYGEGVLLGEGPPDHSFRDPWTPRVDPAPLIVSCNCVPACSYYTRVLPLATRERPTDFPQVPVYRAPTPDGRQSESHFGASGVPSVTTSTSTVRFRREEPACAPKRWGRGRGSRGGRGVLGERTGWGGQTLE